MKNASPVAGLSNRVAFAFIYEEWKQVLRSTELPISLCGREHFKEKKEHKFTNKKLDLNMGIYLE